MTVRLIILLLESAFVQLSETKCAHKMLRMELPEHGGDAPPRDWFVAAGAEGATFPVVVRFAIRLPFVLEE